MVLSWAWRGIGIIFRGFLIFRRWEKVSSPPRSGSRELITLSSNIFICGSALPRGRRPDVVDRANQGCDTGAFFFHRVVVLGLDFPNTWLY